MSTTTTQSPLSFTFRCIGPPRGGRVVTAVGHPTDPMTFYFGACAGGIWKTTDGGLYWENISDGFLTTAAIGALAIAESDPNVLYAGTGEPTIRTDVSWGDGIYQSTDGGKSWRNVGLGESRHVAKIRIHPQNPDLVYVAAQGNAFAPNDERGVYRSKDGGQSWERVLYRSPDTGAGDLAIDANNPRILYAAFYQVRRTFWSLTSGGPECGLFKSTDGGDTWTEITNAPGLPTGLKGKIGVTLSPAKPGRVWAIIEAEGDKAGVYRSDNGGASWEQTSNNRDLVHRPWYYCHIFADPQDADTVYVNNLKMLKSIDAGKTFTEITTPHGDNHDLWIDPKNPRRMINGNDGGACVSFNGGESWSSIYNQLTAQFYHLDVDSRYPYHVYGTQQDNSSIAVPSATEKGGIPWGDCYAAGTGESGYIAVHPHNPEIVYVGAVGSSPGGGGALQRYDHRSKQIRLVTVWPELYFGWGAADMHVRFPWTFPICFSPHDANILYTCGNHVFRSTDEGSSWQQISPDLTRNDASKLVASGGQITLDTSGAEHYCTISAFAESPHRRGELWAGSDDGLLHCSTDDGASWRNLTPPDLPEWSFITAIEFSPHAAETLYLSATRYKVGDEQPYLFKTSNAGLTWQRIDGDFPTHEGRGQPTRVIRADPVRPGLLFVGTESGVYYTQDDGASWQRLMGNLPVVPVYDLKLKDDDLVIATHGRSFWVLDDMTPLRSATTTDTALCPPRPTIRLTQNWGVEQSRPALKNYMMGLGIDFTFTEEKGSNGEMVRRVLDGGDNPPTGAILYYYLTEAPKEPIQLTISECDATGKEQVVRSLKSRSAGTPKEELTIPANRGMNRFVWNLRGEDAVKVPGDLMTEKATTGARVAPGVYQVKLTIGEQSFTQPLEVRADPRVTASPADLAAQYALWKEVVAKVSETHSAINKLRKVRQQVNDWNKRYEEAAKQADDEGEKQRFSQICDAAKSITEKFAIIERELIQTEARNAGDRLRWPARLNIKLLGLMSVISCADFRPPQQAYDVFAHLSSKVDEQIGLLNGVLGDDLAAFNDLVRGVALTPVVM